MLLPRVPLLTIAVLEKPQPVKWHFTHRGGQNSSRRLPPLQREKPEQALVVAEEHDVRQAHARSMELVQVLYGARSPSPTLRRRVPARRRPGPFVDAQRTMAPVQADGETLALDEAEYFEDWDEVRSVQALQSAGSDQEPCDLGLNEESEEIGEVAAQLINSFFFPDSEFDMEGNLTSEELHQEAREGEAAFPMSASISAMDPVAPSAIVLAKVQAPSIVAAPAPPVSRVWAPQAPPPRNCGGLSAYPGGVSGLPGGHNSLPAPLPAMMMPTLDDLLFSPRTAFGGAGLGKASMRNPGRRPLHLEGLTRTPHTAR